MSPEPKAVERPQESLPETFSYWYYRLAEWLAATFPERVGRRLFALAAALQYRSAEGQRRMVARNLSRVLGRPAESREVQAAVRDAFASYARYWYDTFLLRALPHEEIRKRFDMHGVENVDAALEQGRGVIVCLPHMGNWDAAGRWMTLQGYSVTAVAETLKPPRLFELFLRHRQELGMNIVALDDTRKVGEELVRLLSQNEVLALVSDRDLKNKGVDVEMFGETRKVPAGPALLSLSLGTPLLSASMQDTEDGWRCLIEPPVEIERTGVMRDDVKALTRKLAGRFERAIAAAPTQWHMWQPAWPQDLEGS